jgi:hypothetical protein
LRDTKTRKADVLAALASQGQYWLATADGGRPHVIAVSAWWDGSDLVVATLGNSRTARNLGSNQVATLAGGTPDDAMVIQARAVEHQPAAAAAELAEGFAAAMGWDPREMEGWAFFRFRPTRIQAFRGYDEIEGRDVMKDGRWLA